MADRAQANPDSTRLMEAAREARDDAAPSALAAAGALVLLALVGRHAGWELLGHQLWWIWVVVAFPYLLLAAVLLLGLARLVKHDHRREIVIGLLSLVWGFNVLGVGVGLAFWELDCGGPRCPSPFDGAAETRLSVSAGREPRAGSGQLVTSPLGLPLRFTQEFDCVQPD